MALFPLDLPPGVFRNGTDYQSKGRWFESALVRWFERTLRPFGGWMKVNGADVDGPGRGILTWRPESFARRAAIGTVNKLKLWTNSTLLDITPAAFPAGRVDSFAGRGYGFGPYGAGPYGISPGTGVTEATVWSLQTWGSDLLALASHDGKIYYYNNNLLPATLVAAAPTGVSDILVTEEGILVALGVASNRRDTAWSDVRDLSNWTPNFDSFAGDFRVQTDGLIVTGRNIRGGWLLWTTTDLHRQTFIGLPGVYSFNRVGSHGGIVSKRAVQVVGSTAFWMGPNNFHVFDGGQPQILPSDLHDYVFGDINLFQRAKFHSGQIAAFGEVLWFYCSAGSNAIDRCISYNHREGHWNIVDPTGIMARGAWADRDVFDSPLAVGEVSPLLYAQETGWTNDGAPLLATRRAKSGPAEIGNGDRVVEISLLIPDDKTSGKTQVTFEARFTPNGPAVTSEPFVTAPYTPVRITARQAGMTVESLEDADFRVGMYRFEAREGGFR